MNIVITMGSVTRKISDVTEVHYRFQKRNRIAIRYLDNGEPQEECFNVKEVQELEVMA